MRRIAATGKSQLSKGRFSVISHRSADLSSQVREVVAHPCFFARAARSHCELKRLASANARRMEATWSPPEVLRAKVTK